jgi:hypothetical protein
MLLVSQARGQLNVLKTGLGLRPLVLVSPLGERGVLHHHPSLDKEHPVHLHKVHCPPYGPPPMLETLIPGAIFHCLAPLAANSPMPTCIYYEMANIPHWPVRYTVIIV